MVKSFIRFFTNPATIRAGRITTRLAPVLLAVLIAAAPASADYDTMKVMTRNLYLGADIFTVLEAANSNPATIPIAVAEVFRTIHQTDFSARAEAIADEIMRFKPHVIGLQEVTQIRKQFPSDFFLGNPQDAEEEVIHFLDILEAAIAARGLDYRVAVTQQNADVELPMLVGITQEGQPVLQDVRLTDRDAILVRGDIDVLATTGKNYAPENQKIFQIPVPGGGELPVSFNRGYVTAEVMFDNHRITAANTHLEVSVFAPEQAAQMQELLDDLSAETNPIILMGDFNSSPVDSLIDSIEPPVVPPYIQALDAGYIDAWLEQNHGDEGFTCCFNETVDDANGRLYERIDHIFISPQALMLGPTQTRTIGDLTISMPPGGLWPSDHAGVIARVKFEE